MARFNRRFTNPAALRVGGRLPVLGVLTHVGRKTGKRYRTPLLVFNTGDGFAILVGYGMQTNWIRNVLASGEATIHKHGRTFVVGHPTLTAKREVASDIAWPSRWLYRVFPYNEAVLVLTRLGENEGH